MNIEIVRAMNDVVLQALYNKGQETICTLAALKLHIEKAGIVATPDEIVMHLYAMEGSNEIVKTKNSNDLDAWGLHPVIRNGMDNRVTQNGDGAEFHQRMAVQHLKNITEQLGEDVMIVNVKTTPEKQVTAKLTEMREAGVEKIGTLNNLFAVGLMMAHYSFEWASLEGQVVRNGTGYYDPLASVVFVDEEGQPVQPTKTVSYFDEETQRRCYIVVVYPGLNIVIHDRYRMNSDAFVLVCTSDVHCARNSLGMEPAWAEGVTYDFVMLCRMLGFEYDRARNEVYLPRERKENAFEIGLQGSNAVANKIRKMQGAKA
jgi:hypothetical protein